MAKRAEFHNLINDHYTDIIFSSKTWLSPSVSTAEFLPKGYNVFRLDRYDGYGGVLLAFRNTLNIVEYPLTNNHKCEIIAATLLHGDYKIIICSLIPPAANTIYLQNLVSMLKDITHVNPYPLLYG